MSIDETIRFAADARQPGALRDALEQVGPGSPEIGPSFGGVVPLLLASMMPTTMPTTATTPTMAMRAPRLPPGGGAAGPGDGAGDGGWLALMSSTP